ncbi:serine acetyltransferase [Alkalibaculum sp. M08DMB]|uniref:Serine acetyltransferase n=1 Tax=Alkalibaculum sporogenes TaxID=2655001 RepID=A0A6A7KCT4_9FIRM|nr:serine O-acetyltransferase EpsC [Alkalibaculum sporogenes]MPW27121.1 serine acetyltransferase [Alkalibaculum sporogenes]
MGERSRREIINKLVNDILESYKNESCILPHEICPMPNRDTIIEIAKSLRMLLFPGYFEKHTCNEEIMEYHTGELVINIHEKLSEQIIFALSLEAIRNEDALEEICKNESIKNIAVELSYKFLSTIPKVREYLSTDVKAALEGDPAASSIDEIIFSYPGIFAITIHRLAHELYLLNIPLIPRILSEYSHTITGIDINAGAKIGKYFFIDHGTGVVIGETTIIGDNVKIYQGVTLGALSTRGGQMLKGTKRHPTIEDGATIYSGASVFGGKTVIGQGVTIGSNAFITESVPRGTKVSIKNPELILKDRKPRELDQNYSDV